MDILCCRITIGDADPSNPMRKSGGFAIWRPAMFRTGFV